MTKLRFLVAVVFVLLRVLPCAAEGSKPVKVFLFAGQSNMEGADAHRDRIDQFPAFRGAGAVQSNVLFVSLPRDPEGKGAVWGPMVAGEPFGSEVTFARMVGSREAGSIAIIKSAIGGTTMAYDWNPDAPEKGQKLYPRTLRLVRESMAELERRGMNPRLEAVMWHQGENDMLDRRLNTNYAAGLTRMIARLRQDLGVPELKWYVAEVSEKGIWGMDHRPYLAILRRQQDQVLAADRLLKWVPTSHLAFEVMGGGQPHYHFGTQGQLQLGEAFGQAYLDAMSRGIPVPDRRYRGELPLPKKERVRVFVLAGQRNMEGEDAFVSEIGQVPGFGALTNWQQAIPFWYSLGGGVRASSGWEPLGPVGFLGNFGPELSFGARLRKGMGEEDDFVVLKFTHSGAQGPDWLPEGSAEERRNLYPKFAGFLRDAMADLRGRGYDASLAGVFWHVGENDTFFDPYLRKQAEWMRRLIARVRLDLGEPGLPWFISEQHPRSPWKNIEAVNRAIEEVASAESGVYRVPTAQLPHERLHFGTRGTLMLGEAMAEAYLGRR